MTTPKRFTVTLTTAELLVLTRALSGYKPNEREEPAMNALAQKVLRPRPT